MKRMDKAGQQMTLGTIIAIVLGIAVLVFLIFGFSQGWNTLIDRMNILGGGTDNVGVIIQACASSCASQDTYGFCDKAMNVKFGEKIVVDEECLKFDDDEDSVRSSCSSSCEDLALFGIDRINVAPCPGLC